MTKTSEYFASKSAIEATMQTLKEMAQRLTIGFASLEHGEHSLRAVRTESNRILFYVDGINVASSLVPSIILNNWK